MSSSSDFPVDPEVTESPSIADRTWAIKSFYDYSACDRFRESDDEDRRTTYVPPKSGPSRKTIDFSALPTKRGCSSRKNPPEFVSSFESPESFEGLRKLEQNTLCDGKARTRYVVLRPLNDSPSCRNVQIWLKERSKEQNKVEVPRNRPPEDQDIFEDEGPVNTPNKKMKILRVRKNSDDSVGSELSCSESSSSDDSIRSADEILECSNVTKTPSQSFKKQNSFGKDSFVNSSRNHSYNSESQFIEGRSICPLVSFNKLQSGHSVIKFQDITTMSVEIHVSTRQKLLPDPEFDGVQAIFYHIIDRPKFENKVFNTGVLALGDGLKLFHRTGFVNKNLIMKTSTSECELIKDFVKLVEEYDPDIILGYETQKSSWGYLISRARYLNIDLLNGISRFIREVNNKYRTNSITERDDEELRVEGRIAINVWRQLRAEVALTSYTFESVMFHVLHKRIPKYDHKQLNDWWQDDRHRWKVIKYYLGRAVGNDRILEQLDIFGRTAELAHLFGILFYEVLSRGSQFRVESMMIRLAKANNYIPLSPSISQRAKMRSGEYIPLVMEPESRYYTDPVIVLDFQSLYPSIMIAYNYCFSTCLGRVNDICDKEFYEFGCSVLRKLRLDELISLKDNLTFSPGGVAFVKSEIMEGILPRMLKEILNTRLMVKASMKLYKNDSILKRILHSRQLGLKLISNVTYGYTSANFSGRMPCIEVGDSVVSKGRETLERCIKLIEKTPKWGGKVVYGDTDSVFVLLRGRTKDEAFTIGEEISRAVTNDNPKPVKLKFEKVYMPCILQTKKRYVGYMYESRDQISPTYDAKGIETVRRDGCHAVVKMLEKSLRTLFETNEINDVKMYAQRQFQKILAGRVSLQDLTFAKEFRGLNGYRPGACVPSLELTRRLIKKDRMNVPRSGERVPYIIIYGQPGCPLIQYVRSPREVFDEGLRPNAIYYITKVIAPALERSLSLAGADVHSWYADLPKTYKPRLAYFNKNDNSSKGAILNYFTASHCAVCDGGISNTEWICSSCKSNPQSSSVSLCQKIHKLSGDLKTAMKRCLDCSKIESFTNECVSLDCPSLYRRHIAVLDYGASTHLQQILDEF